MRIAVLQAHEVPALRTFAQRDLASSMFLLGNLEAHGFEDRGHPRNGLYAAAWDGDEIVGAAVHYNRGNLTVNAPGLAARVCQAAIDASGRPVIGINGPEDHVDAACEALGIGESSNVQLDEREGLFRLGLDELKVPEILHDDRMVGRVLDDGDVDAVIEMTVRYRIELVGERDDETLRRNVERGVRAAVGTGETWVLECDGELVARSGFNAQVPGAVQVGGVWTPPALRGRGYGRAVVASHLLAARGRGVELAILFTGDGNRAARRAYTGIGFQQIGRYRVLMLR